MLKLIIAASAIALLAGCATPRNPCDDISDANQRAQCYNQRAQIGMQMLQQNQYRPIQFTPMVVPQQQMRTCNTVPNGYGGFRTQCY